MPFSFQGGELSEIGDISKNNIHNVSLFFGVSDFHWPIGPVDRAETLALHQIYWPRASDQGLISQTVIMYSSVWGLSSLHLRRELDQ